MLHFESFGHAPPKKKLMKNRGQNHLVAEIPRQIFGPVAPGTRGHLHIFAASCSTPQSQRETTCSSVTPRGFDSGFPHLNATQDALTIKQNYRRLQSKEGARTPEGGHRPDGGGGRGCGCHGGREPRPRELPACAKAGASCQ